MAASLDAKEKAEHWALNAQKGQPEMFFDPTVQASGLVKGVDVYINNVLVNSNGTLNNHLLHYARVSRIFQKMEIKYQSLKQWTTLNLIKQQKQ